MSNRSKYGEHVAITALRVFVGLVLALHGSLKLLDIPGTVHGFAQLGIPYPQYAVYFAVAGEFLGGLGILFGLLTRVAAFGALCSMTVAIGYAHLGHGILMKNGGWEYPAVLALVAVLFITHGAGPLSIDALIQRKRSSRREFRSARVRSYA